MPIKNELRAVNREIKALTEKIDNLIKDCIRIEDTKVAKKSPQKTVKAKTPKRVFVKKPPVKKKRPKLTATDKVLRIIMKRKRGIDNSTLMYKTGFDEKKVRNIVFKAHKEGKIKRVGRGLYAEAN
jgi:hypothetical protein